MNRNEKRGLVVLAIMAALALVATLVTLFRFEPEQGGQWSNMNPVVGTVVETTERVVPLCVEYGDCSLNGNMRRV